MNEPRLIPNHAWRQRSEPPRTRLEILLLDARSVVAGALLGAAVVLSIAASIVRPEKP